ncbi:hypothetical protein SCALM49S_04257 [Streptomyces californicus]
MSTRSPDRARHRAARLPGASCTVVRSRHSTVSSALSIPPARLPPSPLAAAAVVPADVSAGVPAGVPASPGTGPAVSGGGAWLWRRAHQVWNAAVATSATADAMSRKGPSGWCPIRLAIASATATAVNRAASSIRSRRQWCGRRALFVEVTSVISSLWTNGVA